MVDQVSIAHQQQVQLNVRCGNRFEPLSNEDNISVAVIAKVKAITGNKWEKKLTIGTLSVSRSRL